MNTGSWRAPAYEDTWPVASPPIRDVLARNLRALMDTHPSLSGIKQVEAATALRGLKIGKSTVDRILKSDTPVNLDYVEVLSKVFGVAPWQLLIPDLDPTNPQILRALNEAEAGLYRRITDLAQQIVELPRES